MTKTRTNPTAKAEFVVSRVFAATQERVYHAWTKPKQMAQWWGPETFTNPVCDLDVRPGGAYRIVMRSPEGEDYPLKGVFRRVTGPQRLVMTMDCSEHPAAWHDLVDPKRKGNPNPAGEMEMTASFGKLKARTKLTIRIGFKSAALRDRFLKMGMKEGWSESLDRLRALLAKT